MTYYTPRHLIADPAAGSGGFLARAADELVNPPYEITEDLILVANWDYAGTNKLGFI